MCDHRSLDGPVKIVRHHGATRKLNDPIHKGCLGDAPVFVLRNGRDSRADGVGNFRLGKAVGASILNERHAGSIRILWTVASAQLLGCVKCKP